MTTALPIIAMSRHTDTLNMMALYRGVKPVFFDSEASEPGQLKLDVMNALKALGQVAPGDTVVMTYGDEMEKIGATNAMKIVKVD